MQIISCPSTFAGVIRRRVFSLSTLHGDIGRLNLSNKFYAAYVGQLEQYSGLLIGWLRFGCLKI